METRIEELKALRTFFSGTAQDQQEYNQALTSFYKLTPEKVRLHAHPLIERFEKGILGILGHISIERVPQTAANARRVPQPIHL